MPYNQVPAPPQPFTPPPNTKVLPAGTELHRIYAGAYPGNAFNLREDILNRFSPIWSRGEVVPVLYAGGTREAAIYETLFHDAAVGPTGRRRKALPIKALDKLYGSFRTQHALTLAKLHAPDLAKWGLTVDQLTATNAVYYPQTARWAEQIHTHCPDVHGLEWTSYRAGPDLSYLFFGDRVSSNDLVPHSPEIAIRSSASLYDTVVECGLTAGVRVARPLP